MEYISLAALVAFALSLDRIGSKFISLPHSYGQPASQIQAIAHYTEDELAVAQALRKVPPEAAIVSDLSTMAIVRARTGIGGAVSFSNLDTVAESSRALLQQAINAAQTADKTGYCKVVRQLIDHGAAEYWYAIRKFSNFKSDNDKPDEVRTLFVFSSKTADWAATRGPERISYFPNARPLRKEEIDSVGELGPIIANSNGKTIASLIICPAVEELPANPPLTPD